MSPVRRHSTTRMLAVSAVGALALVTLSGPADAATPEYSNCHGFVDPGTSNSPNLPPTAQPDSVTVVNGSSTIVDVLRNDTDPNGDELTLVSANDSEHAFTCVTDDGRLEYVMECTTDATTDTIHYVVTDGDYYRAGTLTVTIATVQAQDPTVRQRLWLRHKKVYRAALVEVANPDPTYTEEFLAGNFDAEQPDVDVLLPVGAKERFRTPRRRLDFVTFAINPNKHPFSEGRILGVASIGQVDTRTGEVTTFTPESFRTSAKGKAAQRWIQRYITR